MLALHRRTDCLLRRVFLLNAAMYVHIRTLEPRAFCLGCVRGRVDDVDRWSTHTYRSQPPWLSLSLSLSLPAVGCCYRCCYRWNRRALQPNKSDLCHPFTPFHPPSVSFAPLLRNNTPTYVYLYWIDRPHERAILPVEQISETNR